MREEGERIEGGRDERRRINTEYEGKGKRLDERGEGGGEEGREEKEEQEEIPEDKDSKRIEEDEREHRGRRKRGWIEKMRRKELIE